MIRKIARGNTFSLNLDDLTFVLDIKNSLFSLSLLLLSNDVYGYVKVWYPSGFYQLEKKPNFNM